MYPSLPTKHRFLNAWDCTLFHIYSIASLICLEPVTLCMISVAMVHREILLRWGVFSSWKAEWGELTCQMGFAHEGMWGVWIWDVEVVTVTMMNRSGVSGRGQDPRQCEQIKGKKCKPVQTLHCPGRKLGVFQYVWMLRHDSCGRYNEIVKCLYRITSNAAVIN